MPPRKSAVQPPKPSQLTAKPETSIVVPMTSASPVPQGNGTSTAPPVDPLFVPKDAVRVEDAQSTPKVKVSPTGDQPIPVAITIQAEMFELGYTLLQVPMRDLKMTSISEVFRNKTNKDQFKAALDAGFRIHSFVPDGTGNLIFLFKKEGF